MKQLKNMVLNQKPQKNQLKVQQHLRMLLPNLNKYNNLLRKDNKNTQHQDKRDSSLEKVRQELYKIQLKEPLEVYLKTYTRVQHLLLVQQIQQQILSTQLQVLMYLSYLSMKIKLLKLYVTYQGQCYPHQVLEVWLFKLVLNYKQLEVLDLNG